MNQFNIMKQFFQKKRKQNLENVSNSVSSVSGNSVPTQIFNYIQSSIYY